RIAGEEPAPCGDRGGGDRLASFEQFERHPATSAPARRAGRTATAPAASARAFAAACCLRYGGNNSSIAAASDSGATSRVTALYAPSSTTPIASGASTDAATAAASTPYTTIRGSDEGSTSGRLTIAGPPGRSRARAGSLNRWWATIADQAEARTGSARSGLSPITTLALDGPPRISPP